jgi:hypothetical protein
MLATEKLFGQMEAVVKAERKDAVVDAVVEEFETGDLPF